MGMTIQQNSATVLVFPEQDGIMAQYKLILLSANTVLDFFIVNNVMKQSGISIVAQVIVISQNQNLLALELGHQGNQGIVFAPEGHISQDVDGIALLTLWTRCTSIFWSIGMPK